MSVDTVRVHLESVRRPASVRSRSPIMVFQGHEMIDTPPFHPCPPAALQSLNRLIHINNLAACALYTTKLHAELAAEVPTIYQDEPPTQQLVVRTQNTDPESALLMP